MLRTCLPLAIAAACFAAPAAALADDRDATPEERARIEAVLSAEGFVRWDDDIELDDGLWEVDDAEKADGKEWDLKLDQNFNIVERDED